jgi:UDP-glucose 4-epimerase
VGDCAAANVQAMKSDACDEFYNVGTGVRTTIQELTEMILEVTGAQHEIQYEPGGQTFVKNRVGCPDKARAQLGFQARIKLREGIRKLIEWRQSHKEEVARRRQEVRPHAA